MSHKFWQAKLFDAESLTKSVMQELKIHGISAAYRNEMKWNEMKQEQIDTTSPAKWELLRSWGNPDKLSTQIHLSLFQ